MPLALITGASTGIGRATALRLCAGGWTVLAGVRNPEAGERLAADARTNGAGGVLPLALEVTDADQLDAAVARVDELAAQPGVARAGGLDALINNAGIGVGGPLELVSAEDLSRQFDVNVLAQVAVTRALLPALRGARTPEGTGGRIVFVSSVGGRMALPFAAPYTASKHAIEAVGDALRIELRSSGVGVTLIEPGSVATPIWEKAHAELDSVRIPPELEREYGRVPAAMRKTMQDTARRGVQPERVAETIERALSARRMRARYLVGVDAHVQMLIKRLLPTPVVDRMLQRVMGL